MQVERKNSSKTKYKLLGWESKLYDYANNKTI